MREDYIRKAKVINVVDGDTVDAVVDLGYYVFVTERFRLLRINTPETNIRDNLAGLAAKEFVKGKLLDKDVLLQSFKADSFGRWLCEIWYEENGQVININTELLEKGYAVEYIK